MAREYFCAYHSYLSSIEPLNDAERGRLFTALLAYSMTGETQELCGNERFVFPTIRAQIDRDERKYSDFCDRQSINGGKGGRPRKPTETQKTQAFFEKPKKPKEKEKEKAKDKAKAKDISFAGLLSHLPLELQKAALSWIDYKAERKESYKGTGLKSFVAQVTSYFNAYGEKAVCDVIYSSMAANYMGVTWDKLKSTHAKPQSGTGNVFLDLLNEGACL